MNVNQKKDLLIEVLFGLFILAVVYLSCKYILPIILPFITGFLVACIVVKIADSIYKKNKWLRVGIIIIFYGTFGLLLVLLLIAGCSWIIEKFAGLPNLFQNVISPFINNIHNDHLHPFVTTIDPELYATVEQIWDTLLSSLNNIVSLVANTVINFASDMISSVPALFISLLMMIISTFFFAVDYEKMVEFYEENIDDKWKQKFASIKYYLTHTVLVVIRSYALIMLLTFTELSILFVLFGIQHALILAIAIAIFDILPVLGTGGILIPWSILSFLQGHPIMGIKIILIYGIVTIVRNYVEPKIVGAQLGLHPIITLVTMFIGLRLFGFVGMFGLPITISFLWKRNEELKKQKEV